MSIRLDAVPGLGFGDVGSEMLVEFVEVHCEVACPSGSEVTFGVYRESGMVALVGEERGYAGGSVRSVVVSELCEGKKLSPVILLVTTVMSKVLLEHLIYVLCLTIRLWVVSRCKVEMHVKRLTQRAKETRYELGTAIRRYMRGYTVLREYMLYEQ